jgi:hypothetical protein
MGCVATQPYWKMFFDINFTNWREFKYAEGVMAISPVLADAIGLRRENVP